MNSTVQTEHRTQVLQIDIMNRENNQLTQHYLLELPLVMHAQGLSGLLENGFVVYVDVIPSHISPSLIYSCLLSTEKGASKAATHGAQRPRA